MKKKALTILLLCIVFIASLFFLYPKKTIEIKSLENNRTLALSEYSIGDTIVFSFIHSVSNTPIYEYLEVLPDGFYLRKVVYEDQGGAGMPEYAADGQKFYIDENDRFVIDGIDRHFENILITVQEEYEDVLKIGENSYNLYELCGEDCSIEVSLTKRTNLMFLLKK